MPTTIGSQFEAERALAELRTVSRVVGDPRDSEEYTYWETSSRDTLAYAFYSVPDQYRNVPAVKSATASSCDRTSRSLRFSASAR